MTKPWPLIEAEIVDALGQRYGTPPSQILKEDAGILRLVALANMGRKDAEESAANG